MIPVPAQYLLRFDDLCPTLGPSRWQRFERLVDEFGIRPLLAVVPDNMDRELKLAVPDSAFWVRLRAMEAAGATIGLHGYRHVCASTGKSLVPLHAHSEFAGVAEETQRAWIHGGLAILRGHGLNPRVFVAPRHGFDRATLRAVRGEGVGLISDGFARVAFTRGGLTWIPQQLWAPQEKSAGLWTICIHSNTASDALVDELRSFLERHAGQFTSVERVLAECKPAPLAWMERLHGALMLDRIRLSRFRRRRQKVNGDDANR
jgi:predicted deacetylase